MVITCTYNYTLAWFLTIILESWYRRKSKSTFHITDALKAFKFDLNDLQKILIDATSNKEINEDFVYVLFDTILARLLDWKQFVRSNMPKNDLYRNAEIYLCGIIVIDLTWNEFFDENLQSSNSVILLFVLWYLH